MVKRARILVSQKNKMLESTLRELMEGATIPTGDLQATIIKGDGITEERYCLDGMLLCYLKITPMGVNIFS